MYVFQNFQILIKVEIYEKYDKMKCIMIKILSTLCK